MKLFNLFLIFVFLITFAFSTGGTSDNYAITTNIGYNSNSGINSNSIITTTGKSDNYKIDFVKDDCADVKPGDDLYEVCFLKIIEATNHSSNTGGTTSPSTTTKYDSPSDKTYTAVPSNSPVVEQLKIEEKILEKFDLKIGSDYFKEDGNYKGVQKLVLRDKKSSKNKVEFSIDLSNSDLSKLDVEFGTDTKKSSYVIIKNLVLKNTTKSVSFEASINSNSVCIKDKEVNSITEISELCDENQEYVLTCDSKVDSNGYKCSFDDGVYTVSGLKHSAVKEFEKEENIDLVVDQGNTENLDTSTSEDINNTELKLNSDESSSYSIWFIIVIVLVFIIIGVLLLLYFNKKNNIHYRKDINYTFDSESASIKIYVDKYDDIYSLDLISQKLIDAGYNPEKVRNYINKLK